MAFSSRVEYTGSTSTGPYSFSSISLFADAIVPLQSQVIVTITGVVQTYTSGSPVAGEYSMDKLLSTITLGSAPAAADIVKVRRDTSSTAYVDFTNNSPLTAADLDIATQQSLFLAEEGIEAIEAGDAVLALPELTDADSTMAPDNGDFLRWSDADSEWQAQSFTPEGTGPEVNIVTEFPTSPSAGDLIYHSRYGATYIYEGTAWQIMCGTGSVAAPVAGTTVSELTFGAEGQLDGLTLTSGWTCLVPGGAATAGGTTDPGLYGGTYNFLGSPSSSNADWVSVGGITSGTYDFGTSWFASSLSAGGSGELTFDNATYAAEASGDDVDDNIWWGGASESNAGIDATAVLLPRIDRSAMDTDSGFTSGSTNCYQNLLWYYPAGIAWGSTDWRITATFVTINPDWAGTNTDKFASMVFVPKNFYGLDKQAGDITMKSGNDTGGILAKGVTAADAAETQDPPIGFGVASPCTGTGSTSYSIVPMPHINTIKTDGFSVNDFFGLSSDGQGFQPAGTTSYQPSQQAADIGEITAATTTQQTLNGGTSMTEKAITYTLTIEYDAAAKVATLTTLPDSASAFTQGTRGADGGIVMTTDPLAGDRLEQKLNNMDTGFFFNHGANGSYQSATNGSRPDGLVSLKIETL